MSKEGFDPADVAKKNAAAGSLCESVKSIVRYYDEMSKAQPKLQVSFASPVEEFQGKNVQDVRERLIRGLESFQASLP